jgi:hypothetical protein|nr:hypothetical protein [Methanoregula sp. UBA64]
MALFRVISFVHDIEIRVSISAILFEEFHGMRDIIDRMLGDLQAGYDLLIRVK